MQNEAFDFISTLCNWRKGSKAIGVGTMKHFMPTNGVYLYERRAGDDVVIVMMNGTDETNDVDMSRYLEIIPEGKRYRDILTGEIITPLTTDRIYRFAPREVRILEAL